MTVASIELFSPKAVEVGMQVDMKHLRSILLVGVVNHKAIVRMGVDGVAHKVDKGKDAWN